MPVRGEVQNIDAKLLEYAGIIFFDKRTIEPVVETHNQRLQTQFAHDIPKLENAVLSARIRNDTVVQPLVPILGDKLKHLGVPILPVDLGIANLDLRANAAGTGII